MPKRPKSLDIVADDADGTQRIDVYCHRKGRMQRSLFSRPGISILVNGKPQKKSYLVQPNDHIRVDYTEEYFDGVKAEDIPLKVLYEDESVLVIDKPQGMVVHPAAGNWDGTLVNALLGRYGEEFADDGEDVRPGIVHRLDKDTSGVMVVARTPDAQRNLVEQFKAHTTEKIYIALVRGVPRQASGVIESGLERDRRDRKKFCVCPVGEGKYAHTTYRVLKRWRTCSLLRIAIQTGRTHQIRVHFASIGHPVVGDPIYGKAEPEGLMLHAFSLSFDHPASGKRVRFRAPQPPRFAAYLRRMQELTLPASRNPARG